MRQASWEELFRQGREEEAPSQSAWSRVRSWVTWISWEELVTLAIVLVGFLTVVRSIDKADWVSEMPSLYEIAFIGLGSGLVLAHLPRMPGLLAHLIGLAVGLVATAAVIATSANTALQGPLYDRVWEILDRLYVWGDAVYTGGISNDKLPFVVLVVGTTYIAAYVAAWAIFRWYNAWLALIPGGLALLTNISYLPGQKSLPLLVYLFCAIILLARVNVLRHQRDWRQTGAKYPDLISLHVLNVTVWMALALLAVSWVLPLGHGSGTLYSLWLKATEPVAGPARDLGRVFSGIDSKKGVAIHQFGSTMPLQGAISLGSGEVMQVTTSETGFLRAQSYDEYTPQGWKIGSSSQITAGSWPALKAMGSVDEAGRQLRRPVSLQITTSKKSGIIVSAGQPLTVNIDTRVVFGPVPNDVTSVRPTSRLDSGQQYRVDGTVSNASANNLRAAPSTYPDGLKPYLQLPADLPQRVKDKAAEVTAGASNAYDKATAIEQFLRGYAVDLKVPPAPPKQDSVDYFLFDAQRGYFDYHASAMVVMLRSLGIPARLAVGYVVRSEDRVPQTNVYNVHESNAFAWPEVYFPGLGWIEFNPTPSEPPVLRSGIDGSFFPGFDPNEQFLDDSFFQPEDAGGVAPAAGQIDTLVKQNDSNLVSRIILSVVLGVVAITVMGFGVFHYSWQHGLRNYAYPVQIWEKTLRLSRWSRIRPAPQETPREVVARLKRELPEVEDLDYLGESYIRTRYGAKQLSDAETDRLTLVWKRARNNLLARILRWR